MRRSATGASVWLRVHGGVPAAGTSLADKKALEGRKVLTTHLEDGACGWYVHRLAPL